MKMMLVALVMYGLASQVDRQIAAMSTAERVGQLLMVGFDGQTMSPELRRLIVEWRVGGVVLYRPNIASADRVRELNRAIVTTAAPGVPPFIAVDQEGGEVQRVDAPVPQLPSAMAIGATRSPDLSHRAGLALGAALREYGFTMNFAPVLDVAGKEENPALLTRVFSDDPALVASLGAAFATGLWDAGVIPVGKHFPGQGRTAADSHYELPAIPGDIEELRRHDLIPFTRAIAAGLPAVMTAHVAVPRVAETPRTPATLSHHLLTDVLRRELGFKGIVITDELEMRSVRGRADAGEIAVQAILAGADMITVVWNHDDRERVREALMRAVASGRIPETRLRESLRRILDLKSRPKSRQEEKGDVAREIARGAITLLRGDDIPLRDSGALVVVGPDGPFRRRFPAAKWIATPPRIDDEVIRATVRTIGDAPTIVAILGSLTDARLAADVRKLLPDRRFVVVSLGSPRRAVVAPAATTTILAYSSVAASQEAAADVAMGRFRPQSRLEAQDFHAVR